MAKVHRIGEPANKKEREAINYLRDHLPDEYDIFHNLELPDSSGLPYEYDIIVVGEYAVYTVEVKGYGGHIRGNAHEWQLASGAIHKSPIPLANKKAKILAEYLRNQHRLPDRGWVQPLILLTDKRARVRLNDVQAERVLHLDQTVAYILDPRRLPVQAVQIGHLANSIGDTIFHNSRPLHRHREIGEYRILETIGKNNLYTTLLASHRLIHTKQRFTLKVYRFDIYATPGEREKQQARILRDSEALQRLGDHPSIARAHPPFPWQDDQIVLPLDWIDGYSLRGLLESGEPLAFPRKTDIVRQICAGLAYAHRNGVIHRDIRPENVIVPAEGPVKLVNFDCARVEGDNLHSIASRVGRQLDERYVAPEVSLNPKFASAASDTYSAGIILFELLTGKPPYSRVSEVIEAGGLLNTPSQVNPGLPRDVDEVVSRMCAFQPQERYQDLMQAIEDLTIIS